MSYLLPLVLIFLSFNIFAEAEAPLQCQKSQVTLSKDGLARIAEASFNYLLHDEEIIKSLKTNVASFEYKDERKLHKIIFNMSVHLKNFSQDLINTQILLKNNKLKNLVFGDIKIECFDKFCKVRLPLKKLSLVGDFSIKCNENSCMGTTLIGLKRFNFLINSTTYEDAYLDFDLLINTELKINEMFSVAPETVKLKIAPKAQSLELDLTKEEQAIAQLLYQSYYEKRKKEFETKQSKVPLRDMSDVQTYAMADSLSEYLENFTSFSYFIITKSALKEQEVREVQDILSKILGPTLAELVNESLHQMPVESFEPVIPIEAMTPADLLQIPNVGKNKKSRPQLFLQINKMDRDQLGNFIMPLSTCNNDPQITKSNSLMPTRKFSRPPSSELSQGVDLSAKIPLQAINEYLKLCFSDDDSNAVYYEDMAIFEASKKVGLNTKIRLLFNEAPQLFTSYNNDIKKYELFLKLNVTESPYLVKALRRITLPFISSTFTSNMAIDFDKFDKTINIDLNRANMEVGTEQPLILISDLITVATPLKFIKELLFNGLILPGINKEGKIDSVSIQNFDLSGLAPDESGANIILQAKLTKQK